MARNAATSLGKYLYAIIPAEQARPSYGAIGIDGGTVYAILNGKTAAVVSNVPEENIRPQRCHLAGHQRVIMSLADAGSVLPMSFGIIAHDAKSVQEALSLNQANLVEELLRVGNKVEMGLRVSWDVPSIFEYFVATHPELRACRGKLFRGGREPSQKDKLELGRLFARLHGEDRLACRDNIVDVLRSRCFEIEEADPRDEYQVINLACLVGRDGQAEFERAVFEAAEGFGANYSFDYNGPWPPYSFVNVSLQL